MERYIRYSKIFTRGLALGQRSTLRVCAKRSDYVRCCRRLPLPLPLCWCWCCCCRCRCRCCHHEAWGAVRLVARVVEASGYAAEGGGEGGEGCDEGGVCCGGIGGDEGVGSAILEAMGAMEAAAVAAKVRAAVARAAQQAVAMMVVTEAAMVA